MRVSHLSGSLLTGDLGHPLCLFSVFSLLECFWLLWEAIKDGCFFPLCYFNLILNSVKWILIAMKLILFYPSRKNMETFLPGLHIWLILFTLKANYIWCEGKVKFRNLSVLFMNFHSENSGHLFSFLRSQFTYCASQLSVAVTKYLRKTNWKGLFWLAGFGS
jgi:hypothetical protein